MSLKSALGLESEKKVRYGIVALGDISQEALMPAVSHTGNSVIAALISGDPVKNKELAERYDVPADACYSYEQYEKFLNSGQAEAVYIATPNQRHAEFAVPALRAGIHVLLEKPMEVNVAKCEEIIAAQKQSNAKLMVAYRLHFEPGTLAIIDLLRAGELGKIRTFSSTFAQNVKPSNHRAKNGAGDGPLFDMGAYPINAVRNLFEAEPIEVFALGIRDAASGIDGDFDHSVTAMLKFDGNRTAQFTASYISDTIDTYTVMGSDGYLTANPAFGFGQPIAYTLSKSGKTATKSFKATDHFGGELRYFSDCILNDTIPEPDGEEGLLDVRVMEAILKSLQTGQPVKLEPRRRSKWIDTKKQEQTLRQVSIPEPVHAEKPGK